MCMSVLLYLLGVGAYIRWRANFLFFLCFFWGWGEAVFRAQDRNVKESTRDMFCGKRWLFKYYFLVLFDKTRVMGFGRLNCSTCTTSTP